MKDTGDNLQIMDRVQKLLKTTSACDNFLKMQLKINKSKKKSTFFFKMRKEASNIEMLNMPR